MEKSKNMFTAERFQLISDYLKEHDRATIEELVHVLYVSPATVRRDLSEMQKLGMIQRTHGGAIARETAEEVSIFVRIEKNAADKEQTATIAIPHLPDFQSVFIDNSSTCLALSERLDFSYKTVLTNGLQVAMKLSKKKNIKTIILGGDIQYNTDSADGSIAIDMLRKFQVDLMLSSCTALDLRGTYESSMETMEIKKAAFEVSAHHILLADVHKFQGKAIYRTQELSDYDAIYTNAPDEVLAPYRKAGIRIENA
jgi:DeoR/GlpR family transcriptional regulator of sugar metabolism